MVSSLIYYSDTMKYFNKYREEISDLLSDLMVNTGEYSLKRLFGGRYDESDPLNQDCTNQNLLAWFGFEETLRNIAMQFDELQYYV